MWLDSWMIAVIVIMFGVCAFVSRRRGMVLMVQVLMDRKVIEFHEDRFVPYGSVGKRPNINN